MDRIYQPKEVHYTITVQQSVEQRAQLRRMQTELKGLENARAAAKVERRGLLKAQCDAILDQLRSAPPEPECPWEMLIKVINTLFVYIDKYHRSHEEFLSAARISPLIAFTRYEIVEFEYKAKQAQRLLGLWYHKHVDTAISDPMTSLIGMRDLSHKYYEEETYNWVSSSPSVRAPVWEHVEQEARRDWLTSYWEGLGSLLHSMDHDIEAGKVWLEIMDCQEEHREDFEQELLDLLDKVRKLLGIEEKLDENSQG